MSFSSFFFLLIGVCKRYCLCRKSPSSNFVFFDTDLDWYFTPRVNMLNPDDDGSMDTNLMSYPRPAFLFARKEAPPT